MCGDCACPQVGEAALHRIRRCLGDLAVHRQERGQPVQVGAGAPQIAGAFEQLDEVVVEVEDPDVPVGDQVEVRAGRVRMRVGTQERVVVRVEVALVPDRRAVLRHVDHLQVPGPGLAVLARPFEVRVEPGRVGHVELGELEGLHVIEATKAAAGRPRHVCRLHTFGTADRSSSPAAGHAAGK
jgi:hypothetical protein